MTGRPDDRPTASGRWRCSAGEDDAVVDYDDVPIARELPIPLSTVHSPLRERGEQAVTAPRARLEEQDTSVVRLAPEMIPSGLQRPRPTEIRRTRGVPEPPPHGAGCTGRYATHGDPAAIGGGPVHEKVIRISNGSQWCPVHTGDPRLPGRDDGPHRRSSSCDWQSGPQ